MSSPPPAKLKRTRQDWIAAAIEYGARNGFAAIAVEPLASELGTTKGSFYWHFKDRAELLEAVALKWEEDSTTQVISLVESASGEDPLGTLVEVILGHPETDLQEWKILSAAGVPQIGPVIKRVHDLRITFVAKLLRERGLEDTRAEARARVLYAAYLGNLALIFTSDLDHTTSRSALRAEFNALAKVE